MRPRGEDTKTLRPNVTKEQLLNAVIAELETQLERIERASRDNAAAATDGENKAENKYDTRGLEASYLAGGQAQLALELAQAAGGYRSLSRAGWTTGTPIALGAHVTLVCSGRRAHYLLGPAAGGLEVKVGETAVTVVTPASPLGRLLIGKQIGAVVQFPAGPAARRWTVEAVA